MSAADMQTTKQLLPCFLDVTFYCDLLFQLTTSLPDEEVTLTASLLYAI